LEKATSQQPAGPSPRGRQGFPERLPRTAAAAQSARGGATCPALPCPALPFLGARRPSVPTASAVKTTELSRRPWRPIRRDRSEFCTFPGGNWLCF